MESRKEKYSPLFCTTLLLVCSSILALELVTGTVVTEDDVDVVGDFCSILISAGDAESDVVVMKLLDVVTSDT